MTSPSAPVCPDPHAPLPGAADVVDFWRRAGPSKWFAKDAAFDAAFSHRFLALHHAAARRERDQWADTPDGSLALVILLDQLPRNAFRGSAHMFATDPLALAYARRAIASGHDKSIDPALRVFFYLPFEHAEDLEAQARSVALSQGLDAEYLKYAVLHRDIIARFGRFPHRNPLLGRDTSELEQAFLDQGGFAG